MCGKSACYAGIVAVVLANYGHRYSSNQWVAHLLSSFTVIVLHLHFFLCVGTYLYPDGVLFAQLSPAIFHVLIVIPFGNTGILT